MKFLVDRCVGRKVAQWLQDGGHDVVEARSLGPDPGDKVLLQRAESQGRILITIDTRHRFWKAGLFRTRYALRVDPFAGCPCKKAHSTA